MIRTLLVLLCLYEVIHQKIAEMTPLYFKRGTIKAFASENIQEKNDLLFCKAHVVCASTFWSIFFLMFFEVISHPDFFHQDLVFSHPPTFSLSFVFLFYLSELIEKAYFQGWLLILLLIFHLKKSVFSMSFQLQLELQFSPCQILIFWQFLGFCPSVQHQ